MVKLDRPDAAKIQSIPDRLRKTDRFEDVVNVVLTTTGITGTSTGHDVCKFPMTFGSGSLLLLVWGGATTWVGRTV